MKSVTLLQGKKVLLLGGSSGIGLATAKAAAAEGASVMIVSGNPGRLNSALKELPDSATGQVVDLSREEAIINFFATTGTFDHLVYTAGEPISISSLSESSIDAARRYFNIRYWGAVAAVKYGASHINPGGSVVLTSGIASQRPGKGWSLGASICSAMEGFTRAMAVELAPVRVNIVSPGVVRTGLWNSMNERDREVMFQSVAGQLPVQRIGEAADIAATYLHLMQQSYSTGQVITVDGGAVLV